MDEKHAHYLFIVDHMGMYACEVYIGTHAYEFLHVSSCMQNLLKEQRCELLKWITVKTRVEKIRTELLRARADVGNISEKIREARL